jgi:hypothetical protein
VRRLVIALVFVAAFVAVAWERFKGAITGNP